MGVVGAGGVLTRPHVVGDAAVLSRARFRIRTFSRCGVASLTATLDLAGGRSADNYGEMSQHGYPGSCRPRRARSAAAGGDSRPAFLPHGRRAWQAAESRSRIRPAVWRAGPSRERLLPVPQAAKGLKPAAGVPEVSRVRLR